MEIQKDFKEFFALFNAHKVEYVIVGGYALAFHGAPRYTGDIDVLVRAEDANAQKILAALSDFGFSELDLSVNDFSDPDRVLQLGMPPVRIDILTSLTGITWQEATTDTLDLDYGGVPVKVVGREALLANKRATGRAQDLADIEALEGPSD
jgi:hypothetical protein